MLACTLLAATLPPGCIPPSDRTPSDGPRHDGHTARQEQPDAPRVVDYKPGIRIDFRVPQVEIDAEVILRRGQLELFAYAKAPVPKEHETILRLSVSPLHIHEALGLIGLQPGHPMRYFPETDKVQMPTGDPVDVRVRYESQGKTTEVSACAWMMNLETNQPMAPAHWLFTGSRRLEDGRFFANFEGTVVTVVDFDSALLALPGPHSPSDDQLWLGANTQVIPPTGTKAVLILRPASPATRKEKRGQGKKGSG